jgi:hypothetical protein
LVKNNATVEKIHAVIGSAYGIVVEPFFEEVASSIEPLLSFREKLLDLFRQFSHPQ